MFKFSLNALHQVRKRKEEGRQKELAEVMSILKQEENALVGFRDDVSVKLREQLGKNKEVYDNNLSILYDRFQAGKKIDIQNKTDLIERINNVVVEKRQGVLKAYIDRKVIDNFKERKYDEFLDNEKKEEEKEIGDIVTMGFKKIRENAQWCTVLFLCFSVMTLSACGGIKQVAQVDAMNKEHDAKKMQEKIINEEESVELLRDTLTNQNLQNRQLLIEMANLKEKMIEMERMQEIPVVKQVLIEVKQPQTQEIVTVTKDVYEPKVLYKLGYNAILSKKNAEARGFFNDFLEVYPKHSLADNSLYWLGETYYVEQDYKTAIHYFEKIQKIYPKGNKVPDGLLKAGYSYYRLGRKNVALKVIQDLIREYPESSLRPLADKMLGKIERMK